METIQALLVRVHHKSERGDWKVCEMKFKELTDLFGETTFRAAGTRSMAVSLWSKRQR